MIFLSSWSGETAEALFALERTHRIDSLVLAFEQALQEKAGAKGAGALSVAERDVLAVESLEREVNNGGYKQFFVNSSAEFTPDIVAALRRIGCEETAAITARAIGAFGEGADLSSAAIESRVFEEDAARDAIWSKCDGEYFGSGEDIAGRLFEYLKQQRTSVSLR